MLPRELESVIENNLEYIDEDEDIQDAIRDKAVEFIKAKLLE